MINLDEELNDIIRHYKSATHMAAAEDDGAITDFIAFSDGSRQTVSEFLTTLRQDMTRINQLVQCMRNVTNGQQEWTERWIGRTQELERRLHAMDLEQKRLQTLYNEQVAHIERLHESYREVVNRCTQDERDDLLDKLETFWQIGDGI